MPIPASIAITRSTTPEITPIIISTKTNLDLERQFEDRLPFLYDRLVIVPLTFFTFSLSSTVGITIVVGRTIFGVVTGTTDDDDPSGTESYAIPSESYCERTIDGTTRKTIIKHINSF